ncbi:PLP-dependent aminotransferase family protein [Agrobacterium tumefaciens]|uniref:aminotransferase-like domain-containing protein n=1 Tax=Agrobacterium tumefaciens TaxID=358 RepID=UPI0015732517|nr:PLP-dependent aminotransferase family protein [Agrobacterium tumefaciens]NTE65098.1 PLP-dependent aminotransferase family protein [Agrobacterium tumefaciens]
MPSTADLSRNLPPPTPVTDTAFRAALDNLLAGANFTDLLRTHRFMGTQSDREQGARWTARRLGNAPDPARVVLTNGTLSAMNMIYPAVMRPGDTLLTEPLTYPAVPAIARQYGFKTATVEVDEAGMIPEALDAACRIHRPKALYCLATLQNPTTTIMPLERRQAIVSVARTHGLAIIEDDIYSALPTDAPLPFASLAPDITWYVLGLGKSFTVGLRFAYVVAPSPDEARRAFWPGVRSTFWMAAPITAAVVGDWMTSGMAVTMFEAVRAEATARHSLAIDALGEFDFLSPSGAIHGWLNLPAGTREAFHRALATRNVLAGDAAPFVNNGKPVPDAARICFGSPETREELVRGLDAVAEVVRALG